MFALLSCHCEERSDEAISIGGAPMGARLLRFARNDGVCLISAGEALDRSGDALGLLDLRVMGGAGDKLETGPRQRGGELLAIGGGNDAVLVAPQHQRRRC